MRVRPAGLNTTYSFLLDGSTLKYPSDQLPHVSQASDLLDETHLTDLFNSLHPDLTFPTQSTSHLVTYTAMCVREFSVVSNSL